MVGTNKLILNLNHAAIDNNGKVPCSTVMKTAANQFCFCKEKINWSIKCDFQLINFLFLPATVASLKLFR